MCESSSRDSARTWQRGKWETAAATTASRLFGPSLSFSYRTTRKVQNSTVQYSTVLFFFLFFSLFFRAQDFVMIGDTKIWKLKRVSKTPGSFSCSTVRLCVSCVLSFGLQFLLYKDLLISQFHHFFFKIIQSNYWLLCRDRQLTMEHIFQGFGSYHKNAPFTVIWLEGYKLFHYRWWLFLFVA